MRRKTVLFWGVDASDGVGKLWETDGTPAGTQALIGVPTSFQASWFEPFDGEVLFVGHDAQTGKDGLWVTNGTAVGTHELNIAGASSVGIFNQVQRPDFTILKGEVLFQGMDANGNRGLWVTDGTAPGTHELSITGAFAGGIFSQFFSGGDPSFTVLHGIALFTGEDANGQLGLWATDGTGAGTHELTGIAGAAAQGFSPRGMILLKGSLGAPDRVLFAGGDSAGSFGLWVTDGTAAGTTELRSSFKGISDITTLSAQQTNAVFAGTDAQGFREVWVTDGTSAGTRDITAYSYSVIPGYQDAHFTSFGGKVVFEGFDPVTFTNAMWVTDGTASGTSELAPFKWVSAPTSIGGAFAVLNGEMLFNAEDLQGHSGLWATDGTLAGTHELIGTSALFMTVANGEAWFRDGGSGSHLFVTDGTAAGTHEVFSGAVGMSYLTPVALDVAPPSNFMGSDSSDVLLRNNSTGEIRFLDGNGTSHQLGGSGTSYSVVGTGDFNGDGTADILFHSNDALGDTGFFQIVNGSVQGWNHMTYTPRGEIIVGVGHFTSESAADVLFRNNATGDLGFWDNDKAHGWHGIQDPKAAVDPAFSPAYSVVGIGDFTGQGLDGGTVFHSHDDILFRNNATGDLGYVHLNADGTFEGWHHIGGSDPSYAVVGVGDFMGTGTDDILFRQNGGFGDLGFDEMDNGAMAGWHHVAYTRSAPFASWAVAGVGDYNGDNVSDILLRNNLTGELGYDAMSPDGVNTGFHHLATAPAGFFVVG
ncbi:MAG: hypothetical protein C5B56_07100 [Proteobacteria bacterium]|nr:MAG: hypothetical protein C5B56_07100 [Pseudomonadota bacterium]